MKKLLVFLTVVWGMGTGLLFAGSENIIVLAKKLNILADFLVSGGCYQKPTRTWLELGVLTGTMLVVWLWTVVLLRNKTEKR